MPYIANTPESLLSRADSKNPSTTCRGLTSTGRPCRRALAASPSPSSPASHASGTKDYASNFIVNGVVAVTAGSHGKNMTAAFFCWQHKDQAAVALGKEAREVVEVQNRNSIDTLVERMGLLDVGCYEQAVVEDVRKPRTKKQRRIEAEDQEAQSKRPDTSSEPRHHDEKAPRSPPLRTVTKKQAHSQPSFWSVLCCFTVPRYDNDDSDDHYIHDVNDPPRREYTRRPQMEATLQSTYIHPSRPRPAHLKPLSRPPVLSQRLGKQDTSKVDYNNPATLIPSSLPTTTQSLLQGEMLKPLSAHDEPGYIYIFQLTASRSSTPSSSPTKLHPLQPPETGATTQLIKIGRTTNVHRRLTSWSKQCGYNLALLRFYPYVSSSPAPSPSSATTPTSPNKVPYSHRVERLIHIELAAARVKQDKCTTCGKEHREWFEVEATHEGVRRVDEVVKKWVGWAMHVAEVEQS